MTIGQRIKKTRQARRLTQKALGEQAGIAEPTIRKYESDRLHPKYETLEKLAAPLHVTAAYLRDGKQRLGDHLLPEGPEKMLTLPVTPEFCTYLSALSEQRGIAPEELAAQLLSDAVFAALDEAVQAKE